MPHRERKIVIAIRVFHPEPVDGAVKPIDLARRPGNAVDALRAEVSVVQRGADQHVPGRCGRRC